MDNIPDSAENGGRAVAADIKKYMSENTVSHRKLASRAGIALSTLVDILQNPDRVGRHQPTLMALSIAMGKHPGYLGAIFAGKEPPALPGSAEDTGLTPVGHHLAAISDGEGAARRNRKNNAHRHHH